MKLFRKSLAAVACLALAVVAIPRTALAAPINAKEVSSDAKWYIHLDFEALKKTAIYGQILDEVRLNVPIDDFLPQLKAAIGINPLTDITGVTVYNTSFEKDVAAVMVYAKFDKDLLTNAVAQNPDYAATDYNKHTIQKWTDANDGKTKMGCIYGDNVILMGDKEATIKMAIDVLDAKTASGPALIKEAPKGAFLYGSADLAKAGDANVSQLLSNSQAALATASEVDGKLGINVNLTAKTVEQGTQLKALLDGIKAFGELGAKDMPTAVEVLHGIKVSVDGAKVNIALQHDAKTIIETVKKFDAENKAREAKAAAEPKK